MMTLQAFGDRIAGGNVNIMPEMVKAGFMGRKSGKGFYVYEKGTKNKDINQEVVQLFKEKFSLEPKGANTVEDQQLRMVSRYDVSVLVLDIIISLVISIVLQFLHSCLTGTVTY